MNPKTIVVVSVAVLGLLLGLFATNIDFLKQHPIPALIAVLLVVWRLVAAIIAMPRAGATDAAISSARNQTAHIVQRAGSSGTVYLYRPSSCAGAANSVLIRCDDAPAANLKNGSYTVLELPVGPHQFLIDISGRQVEVPVAPGSEHFVRFNYLKGTLDVLTGDTARPQIGKLTRI